MAEDKSIPTPKSADVVSFTIKVNGNAIPETVNVLSLDVSVEMNRIPKARLVLFDGDAATENFEWSNNQLFAPGQKITIAIGYHSEEKEVFKGIITGQRLKVRKNTGNRLILDCKDEYCKLTGNPRSRYFYDAKDSEVIEDVISDYRLENEIESSDFQHTEMVQYQCTDWDFIMLRTEALGKLSAIDNGVLIIKQPKFDDKELFIVNYGTSLLEFDLEVDAQLQPHAVNHSTWDYANQEILSVEATEPQFDVGGDFDSVELADIIDKYPKERKMGEFIEESELQDWADGQLMRARLAKIRGRLQFQGNADVKPFSLLELEGVGDHFNGKILVCGVRHRVVNGNWITDAHFGLDPTPFAIQHGLNQQSIQVNSPISGLQIGVVTQLQDDPNGEFRMRVRLPAISLDEDGIWARMATVDAGENRGFFFRPEIDDEVVVGFVNQNSKEAIVLGCLHSSNKPSPLEPSDDNHEKGIVTRSENKILINDETNTISIETPAGKKITLDEDSGDLSLEDDEGNKIMMNADGITIESSGDIQLKAGGDVSIKGTNIENEANSSFSADGKSGAELSSNGTAVIKGSIVQIN